MQSWFNRIIFISFISDHHDHVKSYMIVQTDWSWVVLTSCKDYIVRPGYMYFYGVSNLLPWKRHIVMCCDVLLPPDIPQIILGIFLIQCISKKKSFHKLFKLWLAGIAGTYSCCVQSTTMHTPLKSLQCSYNCWTYHSPYTHETCWSTSLNCITFTYSYFAMCQNEFKVRQIKLKKRGNIAKSFKNDNQTPDTFNCEGKSLNCPT